jgi:sugar phosphate isomerase/epimerase
MSRYELIAAGWTTAGAAQTMTDDDRSPVDIRTRVELAGRAGFRGFGLAHLDLLDVEQGIGFPAFRSLLADNGIVHFEIEFLMDWFATGERRAVSDIARRDMLRAAEAVGARHIKVGDHRGADIPIDQLVENFAGLATDAAEAGTRITLEPMPFGSINTPTRGLEVVRTAGHPAGGLLIDIWHVVRAGVDIKTLRDLPVEHITHVELDDAPLTFEGDMLTDTFDGRTLCGEGEFDVAGFIAAIKDIGYDGPWGVEILGAEYRKLPVEQAIPAAYDTTMHFLDPV